MSNHKMLSAVIAKMLSAVIAKSTGPEDQIKKIGSGEWFYIPGPKSSDILKNFSNN